MFEEPNTVCDLVASDKCRLDNFIGGERSDLSRSRIKRLIEEGNVSVGGKIIEKAGYSLRAGDSVRVVIPPPRSLDLTATDLDRKSVV